MEQKLDVNFDLICFFPRPQEEKLGLLEELKLYSNKTWH